MNIVRLFLNTSSRWYYPLHWLGILALGLVVYYRAFGCGFVFDDNAFIITNPYIKHFSRINEVWAFFPMTRLVGMYSFTLNYFTNQLHPFGYHLFNFIVHLIATALVWGTAALLFKITRKEAPADALQQELPFIMALLFLVHPGQTQAVTYISQRFESMAAVFYLATVYTYLSARVSPAGIPRIRLFVLAGMHKIHKY